MLICSTCFANENVYHKARDLQRNGKYDEAINVFKNYLSQPLDEENLTDGQLKLYTDALLQLMNTFHLKKFTNHPQFYKNNAWGIIIL